MLCEPLSGLVARLVPVAIVLFGVPPIVGAQQPVPQPFPRPAEQRPAAPQQPSPSPAAPSTPAQAATPRPGSQAATAPPSSAPATQSPTAPPQQTAAPASAALPPTEAGLGISIYPNAQFIGSYDAGRGQRYYLFGTTATYEQIVLYYRNVLKQRGDVVFEEPPTHIFEVGRFRQETMAFPPSITVKDYLWGGSSGYLNPKLGAEPQRFATIIQIVPPPPAAAR